MRSLRSSKELERHKMAIISLAGVMSNPVSWGIPLETPPKPVVMLLKERSFTSKTRRQSTARNWLGFPRWLYW